MMTSYVPDPVLTVRPPPESTTPTVSLPLPVSIVVVNEPGPLSTTKLFWFEPPSIVTVLPLPPWSHRLIVASLPQPMLPPWIVQFTG
jgi:hypothetical protein